MVFDVVENLGVGEKVDFRAALIGGASHRQGRYARAAVKLHLEHFALTADGQPQPRRQRIDAGNAHPVQAARNLVRVLVELAARMQFGQDDFRSAAADSSSL